MSILLRPGKYLMTETIELIEEEELDIIGDINEDEEPSDVSVYCKGTSVIVCDKYCKTFNFRVPIMLQFSQGK